MTGFNYKKIIVSLPLLAALYILYLWYRAKGFDGMMADVQNTLNNLEAKLPMMVVPVALLIFAPGLIKKYAKGDLGIVLVAAVTYIAGIQAVSAISSGAGVGRVAGAGRGASPRLTAPVMRRV